MTAIMWDHFRKKACFSGFQLFDIQNVVYILHTGSEYLSWSCKAMNFLLAIHFSASVYISIAPTGNFIIHVLGPFS